ncbi:protein JASON-like isoform X2 [Mangifera indica]|uniref:protein JASON-like isoform X2 n=1 Tax=Mangifera indica TaxID=29780 RepID=UPI001CFAB2D9|nr:protein JASON-like isoform X2 [Mangifera indica]
MIFEQLNRQILSICTSVSRAMGCLFGCFRIKDDRSRIPHSTIPTYTAVVSKNRLSALFLSEEKEDSRNQGYQRVGSPHIEKGLTDEAKFLKACGTLPETPAEIRKASEKFRGSASHDKDSEPSKFHSWLPNTSIKTLQLDRQSDQRPIPTKLFEGWGMESASSPSSCISDVQNSDRISIISNEGSGAGSASLAERAHATQNENITTSLSPWVSGTNVQDNNKSVRFECDIDVSSSKGSSSGYFSQNSKHESTGNESVSKPSPNPTPLKVSDDMQTPGTVFPTSLKSLANGKARIRSQYVYSVSNPVENASQWKALKTADSDSHQLSGQLRESLEQSEDFTPIPNQGTQETSIGIELKVEASLSAWLKPPSSSLKKDNKNLGVAIQNRYFRGTPSDRPIIGMVAAHWNEETPQVQPRWWDGNGIPNSTNKYKEDQKVSWHATPFEERLEKALSEESFISQRKNINQRPTVLDENEESDTALSQLRPSPLSKSAVSY